MLNSFHQFDNHNSEFLSQTKTLGSCISLQMWSNSMSSCVRREARHSFNSLWGGEFKRRQRERHWTNELISRTMAVHLRYNSWYISLPFSANLKWPNFVLSGERTPQRLIRVWIFIPNLPLCSEFSFAIVLTMMNKVNDFRVPQVS